MLLKSKFRFLSKITKLDKALIFFIFFFFVIFFSLKSCTEVKDLLYKDLIKSYENLKIEAENITKNNKHILIRVDQNKRNVNVTNDTIVVLEMRIIEMTEQLDEKIKTNKLRYSDLVAYKQAIEDLRSALISNAIEVSKIPVEITSPSNIVDDQLGELDRAILKKEQEIGVYINKPLAILEITFQTLNKKREPTYIIEEINYISIVCRFDNCYFQPQTVFLYLNNQNGRILPAPDKGDIKQNGVKSFVDGDKIVIQLQPGATRYIQESKVGKLSEGEYYLELRSSSGKLLWETTKTEIIPRREFK